MSPERLIGRTQELGNLDKSWRKAVRRQPQLVVLWGRRRVGKTFLLSHFARQRRCVFFGATEQAETVELRRLLEAVARGVGQEQADLAGGGFSSWEAALRYFAALAKKQPLLVVLDEVPYLLRSTPGFASIVQHFWDHLAKETRLMLVLTGSAISIVERLLGPGGPLRGRPTLPLRLEPLNIVEGRAFFPRASASRYFEAYAACGGYPLHLHAWDARRSTSENLLHLAGSAGGLLLTDAASMLAEELPEAGGHARILAAVGRGRTRFGQIASEAGQRIEAPLDTLLRAGFLRKALPVGAPKGARATYEIADPYLAFWFSCLYANETEIGAGEGRALVSRIAPVWQRHLGWVFEEAARDHATRMVANGRLPEDLLVGRWWASTGQPCEVDVLGLRGSRTALIGEARWQNRRLQPRDARALRAKVARVPSPLDNPVFALWGRSGVMSDATRGGVLGFSLRDVLEG